MYNARMRNILAFASASLLALLLAGPARAGEKIDNPSYTMWAKFKVGAWARTKTESGEGEAKSVMKMTTKLVERTDEKLVIETSMTVVAGGQEYVQPATKQDVPAKMDKPEAPKEDPQAPKVTTKEGEDTIEVAGRKWKCKTTESTLEGPDLKSTSKSWMTGDVPGGVVKSETVMEKPMAGTTTTVLEDFKVE